ncbi:MAG: PCRF domain-containing protein, partial [Candidatus Dojkabacteria bacterium]
MTKKILENDKELLDSIISSLNLDAKKDRLKELEDISIEKDFWGKNQKAQKIMKLIESIRKEIDTANKLNGDLDSLIELHDDIENSEDLIEEYQDLHSRIKDFERLKFLSGKYDDSDALLSIHAGQGGTESNDWAQMLLRMYQMYFDSKGWKYEIEHMEGGSEAGISNVTMKVSGEYVYGLLKREHGAHRLVRISPFNAQGLRQTTFAGVEVIPVMERNDSN